jgi:hypothetical protein
MIGLFRASFRDISLCELAERYLIPPLELSDLSELSYKGRRSQAKPKKTKAKILHRRKMNKPRIVITNQDAKLVLSAYRPSGSDARDPFFEEALEQTKRDPELREWFVKERAFDDFIVSKLRTIEPSAGLHSEILARLRAIRAPRRPVGPWLAGLLRVL